MLIEPFVRGDAFKDNWKLENLMSICIFAVSGCDKWCNFGDFFLKENIPFSPGGGMLVSGCEGAPCLLKTAIKAPPGPAVLFQKAVLHARRCDSEFVRVCVLCVFVPVWLSAAWRTAEQAALDMKTLQSAQGNKDKTESLTKLNKGFMFTVMDHEAVFSYGTYEPHMNGSKMASSEGGKWRWKNDSERCWQCADQPGRLESRGAWMKPAAWTLFLRERLKNP